MAHLNRPRSAAAAWLRWGLLLVALMAALGLRPLALAHSLVHAGADHTALTAQLGEAHAHEAHHLQGEHGAGGTAPDDWLGHAPGESLCAALDAYVASADAPPSPAFAAHTLALRQPPATAELAVAVPWAATEPRARGPPDLS